MSRFHIRPPVVAFGIAGICIEQRPHSYTPEALAVRTPRQVPHVHHAPKLGTRLAFRTDQRHSHDDFVGKPDADQPAEGAQPLARMVRAVDASAMVRSSQEGRRLPYPWQLEMERR
jgi:hypothetical protein